MIRRSLTLATAAALFTLLAWPAAAAEQAQNHVRRPRCNNILAIARIVQLTPAQREQAREIFGELRQAVEPLRQQIPPLREAIEELLDADEPVACDVGQAVVDIDALRDQIQVARETAVTAFEAILTPEQLERWENFQEHCREGYQHGD
jgi:Spy/CpxP family protein refolding chaperone